MSSLRTANPEIRDYFRRHNLLDVYEMLLCGVIAMRPEDPLRFLEEKLKDILEKRIDPVSWSMCIDMSAHPELKIISETYVSAIFGIDCGQVMTEELCAKAWAFHSKKLMKLYFQRWIKFLMWKRKENKKNKQLMARAGTHYKLQVLRVMLRNWSTWVHTNKGRMTLATARLQDVFNKIYLKAIIKAWLGEVHSSRKMKSYFESLASDRQKDSFESKGFESKGFESKGFESEDFESKGFESRGFESKGFESNVTVRRRLSHIPEEALLQVFRYVNLIDLARCAQVSQRWMRLTQNTSLWSGINFSAVKHKIHDQLVVNTLHKWRPYVLYLNLRGCNSLHWPSFRSISQCKNLQDLNLSECQGLTGRTKEEAGALQDYVVQNVSLDWNVRTTIFHDESMRLITEGCRALLYLNLSYTDITDRTLRLLSSFTNLQYLSIAHCRKFTDKGLLYLGSGRGCHKLMYLDLSGCSQVSVDGFRNIANACSGIQDLLMNKMPTLTDICIQVLVAKCQQIISVVFLDSPHLSDAAFEALGECRLVKVGIEGNNQITDLSLNVISNYCPWMRHIHMVNCQKITDAGLQMISTMEHITVLNVAGCIRISDDGVSSFVQGSSGATLRELNLSNCINVTDASVTEIAQRCHALTYLSLRYCENVTDAGMEAVGEMSSLISIDLSGTIISDVGLIALGSNGNIKKLTMANCKNISDAGIEEFCEGTNQLEYFNVSHCPQLTSDTLVAVAFHCQAVTSVNVAGCPEMTDTCIKYLAAACHYLYFLDISGCVHLTDNALQYLREGCKRLQILRMLYCRKITKQAVLKYTAKLKRREYNDADPPSSFGYDRDGNIFTSTQNKTSEPE